MSLGIGSENCALSCELRVESSTLLNLHSHAHKKVCFLNSNDVGFSEGLSAQNIVVCQPAAKEIHSL